MSLTDYDDWELEALASDLLGREQDREQHRQNNHDRRHTPKMTRREVLESLADEVDVIGAFEPTYLQNFDDQHHEYDWLMSSLGGFYMDKVIADVVSIIKAGKEANVYACTGTAASGHPLMAAKLYRPRMLRHLRNDAVYKEGRLFRSGSGEEQWGGRLVRALKKKTAFGREVDFATWILHEFKMQQMLYAAGAAVPEPIAQRDNTILMAYIGDEYGAARTLSDTAVDPAEATGLYDTIMGNVELMLAHNFVHGDLSAYNILYHAGQVTIIDFPQMADARVNPHAFELLERDVLRVCQYFADYGVDSDPARMAADLWQQWRDGLL